MRATAILMLLAGSAGAAQAQERERADEAPRRTRIALGPQLVPSSPGSDQVSIRPFLDVSRARGDAMFAFEAPDESSGFALVRPSGIAIGPAIGFEGVRRHEDVGGATPRVGFTVELGGFVQAQLTDAVRLRGEVRKGLGGHRGWIGNVGADYMWRDRDAWLFSIGPRVTLADDRYHRAYFGVAPADAIASGVPAFEAKGGVQAVGATAGLLHQFGPRWGVSGYAKYDRLVGDPADSPLVERFGSRNQLSGGLALTYTFGG